MKQTIITILYTCSLLLMVCINTLSGKVPTNEAGAQKLKEEIAKIDGNTKAKADMLFDLGFYVLNSDVDSAGRLFDRVKEVSEDIDYKEGLINHLAGLCNVLNYKKRP